MKYWKPASMIGNCRRGMGKVKCKMGRADRTMLACTCIWEPAQVPLDWLLVIRQMTAASKDEQIFTRFRFVVLETHFLQDIACYAQRQGRAWSGHFLLAPFLVQSFAQSDLFQYTDEQLVHVVLYATRSLDELAVVTFSQLFSILIWIFTCILLARKFKHFLGKWLKISNVDMAGVCSTLCCSSDAVSHQRI